MIQATNNLRNSLLKQVECAICLDTFQEPTVITKCQHVFCKTCISHYFNNKVTAPCPKCKKEFKAKHLVHDHNSQSIIDELNKNKIEEVTLENKENAYAQVPIINETAKNLIVEKSIPKVSTPIIQNPAQALSQINLSHFSTLNWPFNQQQINHQIPQFPNINLQQNSTQNASLVSSQKSSTTPRGKLKGLLSPNESVKVPNGGFKAQDRDFKNIDAYKDIELSNCHVAELVVSKNGSITAKNCTFGSVNAFRNINLTNCEINTFVSSANGSIFMDNCSSKDIKGFRDITLNNNCIGKGETKSVNGSVNATACELKTVIAYQNIIFDRCVVTDLSNSSNGELKAINSKLSDANVYKDATFENSNGKKIISKNGDIEAESTKYIHNSFDELNAYKNINIKFISVPSVISQNGKVSSVNCLLDIVKAFNGHKESYFG